MTVKDIQPVRPRSKNGTFQRLHKPSEKMVLGHNVDQQLLSIISGQVKENVVRTRFLQMAQGTLGATAACFLVRSRLETWLPGNDTPRMGRLPGHEIFDDGFSKQCDDFARSPNIQHTQLGESSALLAPIRTSGSSTEIMLVLLPNTIPLADATRVLQKMAAALQIWMRSQLVQDNEWQITSLGTIVELIGRLEKRHTIEDAADELANLLANHLGCTSVAVGLKRRNRIRLNSISGVAKIDHSSDTSKSFVAALTEVSLRKQSALFPPIDPENNHLLQAHRQLATQLHCEAVFSFPLFSEDDEHVGAVVLTGATERLGDPQVDRFCTAAAPAIARTLHTVNRVRLSRLRRALGYVREKCWSIRGVAVMLLFAAAIAALFVPVTYRVRCNCVTEVVTRRFAVAPFDGLIVTGEAKAGDPVTAGQTLCEMDGRTIRWELSGVSAQRQQSVRTREIELTDRNIPKAFLAELEHDRLTSEEEILQYKRDHLLIKSPIDGVILSGDVERSEAASVETGQVLFEIGPLQPMRVQIAVPADEIAQVREGQAVKIWIDGQEDEPIEGQIHRIKPRSETRDARNVFVAEVEFPNKEERLRPGMSGTVRIDCDDRQLGWSLFHKPMNYMRSHFAWW